MSKNETTKPEAGETRYDYSGPIRCMTVVDNYVMCRRPRCIPWVLSIKDWLKLPDTNECVGNPNAPYAMHHGVLNV